MLAADPIITEFVASNKDTLHDGYGATPDWIEIYNNGDQSVDLEDYSLTDDPDEIDKWQFPQVLLDPGEFLIVFASGNDAIDPRGNLHTNFGLSSEGDYLALADPQDAILSEFSSGGVDFPELLPNTSYGFAFDSTFTEAVSADSAVKYLIPTDGSVDATWTGVAFDDSAWQSGTASLGYEESEGFYDDLIQTTLPVDTQSVYVRIPFTVSDSDAVIGTLQMKYDDGFVAYLNGVPIAQANAPGSVAFDSLATDFHVQEAAIQDVVFNVSEHSGLLQVGQNILSIHLMDADESPVDDLLLSPTLTIATGSVSTPETVGGLISTTPGLPNTQVLASDVVFSRPGGAFADPFQLTITANAGDTIRYTIDGSEPLAGSLLYAGPISISTTTLVRARTYDTSGNPGQARSAAFSQSTFSEADSQSTLPIVVLENFGEGKPGKEFQDAFLSLYEVDELTGTSNFLDEPTLTTPIGQHRRGSSSFGFAKYNLRVELRDDNGEDNSVTLLGMPADSDWILHGTGAFDRSLLRNVVAYDLSNQADNPTVRTRYVEVYNNTNGGPISESDYFGIYVFMETIKVGENRVDIESLDPSDTDPSEITGGFIYKRDRPDTESEDANWVSERNYPLGLAQFVHVSPEISDLTRAQVNYLRDYIQDFEDALFGPNSTDPDIGYEAYIDSKSWVEHHLLRVFINDSDTLSLSEFFTKDRDGKIHAGPVWDFNLSSGRSGGAVPASWDNDEFNPFWAYWNRLFNDPDFAQLWVDKWWALRSGPLSNTNLSATVSTHAGEIQDTQERNFDRWTQFPPSDDRFYGDPQLTGWEAEVAHLEGWLLARADWIDTQMTPPVEFSHAGGFLLPGTEVDLSIDDPGAVIYYTTDGTDPRGDGGALSLSAVLYTGPITINSATTVKARAFNASRNSTDLGPWGASTTTFFATEAAADITNLRISELHYNPLDPSATELLEVPGADNNDFEFIELINISENPLNLNNVRFTDGVTFDFTSGNVATLAPGETVLVVKNQNAFEARYGLGFSIAGEYEGKLSGGGEQVVLVDSLDNVIHDFEYDDSSPWPEAADGDGPSLEVIDLLGDLNDPTNWQASVSDNGTPGSASPPLLGDYDRSGTVDQLDHTAWINQFGDTVTQPGVGADGNFDGIVNAADYTVWRDHLGQTQTPALSFILNSPEQAGAKVNPLTNDEHPLGFAMLVAPTDRFVATERINSLTTSTKESNRLRSHDLAMLILTDRDYLSDQDEATIDTVAKEFAPSEDESDNAFLDWETDQSFYF